MQHFDTIRQKVVVTEERQAVAVPRLASQASSDLLIECRKVIMTETCHHLQPRQDRPPNGGNVVLCPHRMWRMFLPMWPDRIVVQLLVHIMHPRKERTFTAYDASPLPRTAVRRRSQRNVQLGQTFVANLRHRRLTIIVTHLDTGQVQCQSVSGRRGYKWCRRPKATGGERPKRRKPRTDKQTQHLIAFSRLTIEQLFRYRLQQPLWTPV